MGKTIVISPKETPILNDATVDDVEELGLGQYGAIIPHTHDTIGLTMEVMTEGFMQVWDNSDLDHCQRNRLLSDSLRCSRKHCVFVGKPCVIRLLEV